MEVDPRPWVTFFQNTQYGHLMAAWCTSHGGGIDAPLGVVRMEYSSELYDAQVIVPHNDWRGTYDRGTTILGSCLVYSTNGTQLAPPPDSTPSSGDQYGGVVGGGTYSGTKEHCIDVDWPAAYTWSARQYRRGYSGPDSWMGSLIFESRDASGLYYRRNRYYDSEKGRFTQEDPIGLAGGVNVYGFAGGDPVSYADPYGLNPEGCCKRLADWVSSAFTATNMTFGFFFGAGPTMYTYREGSPQVEQMRNAPGVQQARAAWDMENAGNYDRENANSLAVDYPAHFGLSGAVRAGLNPTRQFVGSYNVHIEPNPEAGTLTITIRNTTSLPSALYHLPGLRGFERTRSEMMSNVRQQFIWTEKMNEGRRDYSRYQN
jgi:RHS repeat-associated protein